VHFLRCVLAEWPLLRARLVRTRLGLWLALLTIGLLAVNRYAPAPDPLRTALDAGALGAVLCVAYLAGSVADRRALPLLLSHPTTPAAVAGGRWLAATGGAAVVVVATGAHSAWTSGAIAASAGATLAGLVTAGAVAACALMLAWRGGNLLVGAWFAALALFGHLAPGTVLNVPRPGAARFLAATLLVVLPTPSHYRAAAWGSGAALLHAVAWITLGVALAVRSLRRVRATAR
jgi:hypothetical protein